MTRRLVWALAGSHLMTSLPHPATPRRRERDRKEEGGVITEQASGIVHEEGHWERKRMRERE